MNYSNLRTQILATMKYPPKITAQALQEQLINIVNGLDLGALLLGVATPSLTPNTEANGFYFGLQPGTYTNFPTINGETITLDGSEVAIIVRSGNYWSKILITTYPSINPENKHWMVGNEDTGVLAEGTDGVTPHIDPETGNWFIETTNTGIHAQGAPGQNAVNPFKGWFDAVVTGEAGSRVITSETQNLPANPIVGDYAYVKTWDISGTAPSQTETPIAKIYECTIAGSWSDSGRTVDASNVQTFESGEEVNETYIDDTHLVNPKSGALAISDDILNLPNPAFIGIDFSEVQTINYTIAISSSNWAQPTNAKSAIIPVYAGSTIHITTIGNRSAQYGFLSSYPNPVVGESAPLVDGLYFLKTTSFPETERTQIVPQNAKYIYVKLKDGDTNYTPNLQIKSQKFLVESDIIDNLDSEDSKKALSARQGPEIKRIKNSLNAIITPSLEGNTFNAMIGISTLNWVTGGNNARCAIIPVNAGDTLHIEAEFSLNYVQYGYLTEYPNPVNGEAAPLLDGLYYLNSKSFPQLETTEIIPELAKYLYIKLADGTYNHTPKKVEITPTRVTYDYIDDVIEYDSYIEENILRYESSLAYSQNRIKLYKIDPKINYKLILRVSASTTGNVEYLDANLQLIGTEFDSDTSELLKMVDMNIPQNCAYIRIKCYISDVSSGTYTYRGCGAIMKPITNDIEMPTNRTIFCVSKIKSPVMPYNYSDEEISFQQSDVWSAWAFMLPYNINSLHGKKLPLVAFFHGSSGFVTSEYMGYNAAATRDGIVGSLRSKGFVVFDVNGYGISYDSDDFSKHWGCPLSVLTAKKAYEILTSIFNCRKGMIISGISMGGAIAKSYCMTYPNDTIGCALEAPSEMGMTARFSPGKTVWKAWGYASAQDMLDDTNRNAFIGCSPLIKPLYKDAEGNVKAMSEVMDFSTQNAMYSNISNFIGEFPVEIKIWHGDADTNVDLRYSQMFVNTVRNANGLATLRLCPNCTHNLNEYPWVMREIIDYITDKISL